MAYLHAGRALHRHNEHELEAGWCEGAGTAREEGGWTFFVVLFFFFVGGSATLLERKVAQECARVLPQTKCDYPLGLSRRAAGERSLRGVMQDNAWSEGAREREGTLEEITRVGGNTRARAFNSRFSVAKRRARGKKVLGAVFFFFFFFIGCLCFFDVLVVKGRTLFHAKYNQLLSIWLETLEVYSMFRLQKLFSKYPMSSLIHLPM